MTEEADTVTADPCPGRRGAQASELGFIPHDSELGAGRCRLCEALLPAARILLRACESCEPPEENRD